MSEPEEKLLKLIVERDKVKEKLEDIERDISLEVYHLRRKREGKSY